MLPGALAAVLALTLIQASPADVLDRAEARARAGAVAEAMAELRAALPGVTTDRPTRARILNLLAVLESRQGDAAAVDHAVEAAGLFEAIGDRRGAADARNTAGLANLYAGRYLPALTHFTAALAGSAAVGDWAGQAEQLSNLANVHYFLGRYDEAALTYGQVLTLVEAHRAEPWAARRRRIVLANQAALDQRLGRYAQALERYREMSRAASEARPEEQAQILVNQGVLYRRLGDPYKALDHYRAAQALFATHAHVDGELGVLTNRGIVFALDLQQPSEAVGLFDEALTLAGRTGNRREQLLARLYRAEAALRAGRHGNAVGDFVEGLRLAEALEAPEEAWKAHYGLARAQATRGDIDAARASFDHALDIVDTLREQLTVPSARADFFQDKRDVYDARMELELGAASASTLFALLERGRARAWRDRFAWSDVGDLAAIQRALSDQSVLLAYWHTSRRAAVVRITRRHASVHQLTLPPGVLDRLVTAMRTPESGDWQPAAADAGRALLPEGVLGDARHVIVVPDGPLGLVPFDALLVDGMPLGATRTVRSLPAAAALLAPTAPAPSWQLPWTTTLAAFGDPLPGRDTWTAAASRLPASAEEVRAIDATLGGAHAIFLGADNRKAQLVHALDRHPTVLHIATHGVADPAAAERSRLVFSPASTDGPPESLFLREVYELPLDGVALAVLSACETERGPLVRGEGIEGFSRALMAAGARSTVTTLWRVPDAAAARLMAAFYDRLQAGDARADALAAAKRTLQQSATLAHPHYWAAFVLTGEDGPLPRAPRWSTLLGTTLLGCGGVLVLLALRPRRQTD